MMTVAPHSSVIDFVPHMGEEDNERCPAKAACHASEMIDYSATFD